MESSYTPYFDPDFESLIERIYPPRVCIDNETCPDCTLVKVDSANKHGILLEMVQVLTDLDLAISKSYICSDGGWFMDVFHVTDQLGNKLTDKNLFFHIQQALGAERKNGGHTKQARTSLGTTVGPPRVSSTEEEEKHTTLEITATDRPGLLSEISAVLAELRCHVVAAEAWTHNTRAASIIYVDDEYDGGGPISDPDRLAHVQEQLEHVVGAHHHHHHRAGAAGEQSVVRLAAGPIHSERRLHQLMFGDRDYDTCCNEDAGETHVSIESCTAKGYSVVNIRSRDRRRLLFDTVCTLTDMQYVVFHAAISSQGSVAVQEYYIRHKDGCTLDTESERSRVSQCLVAAIERSVSHGLRLDICTQNKTGLLSDITRVFRENGLSVSRAEIGIRDEKAVGSFHVTELSGKDVNPRTIDLVRKEIGPTVVAVNKNNQGLIAHKCGRGSRNRSDDDRPRFSLGSLLWAQLERLSSNFGSIRS